MPSYLKLQQYPKVFAFHMLYMSAPIQIGGTSICPLVDVYASLVLLSLFY